MYRDFTGHFPYRSGGGKQYIMVIYNNNANLIWRDSYNIDLFNADDRYVHCKIQEEMHGLKKSSNLVYN